MAADPFGRKQFVKQLSQLKPYYQSIAALRRVLQTVQADFRVARHTAEWELVTEGEQAVLYGTIGHARLACAYFDITEKTIKVYSSKANPSYSSLAIPTSSVKALYDAVHAAILAHANWYCLAVGLLELQRGAFTADEALVYLQANEVNQVQDQSSGNIYRVKAGQPEVWDAPKDAWRAVFGLPAKRTYIAVQGDKLITVDVELPKGAAKKARAAAVRLQNKLKKL